MLKRKLGALLAAALAIAAQPLGAQVTGGLPAEINAREAADVQLQKNISAEAAARTAADTALQKNIDAETAARALGEAQLQGGINAEAAARAAADAALRSSIEGEAGARAAGDANLQRQIDQLSTGGGNTGGAATVDCAAGQTVSQALDSGAKQITVRGTCTESLEINRDGVTLLGEAGATISGPDPNVNTINVRANRVTIDGLTVTGGRNGITGLGAANLTVRNCNAQFTGRTGISYVNGSSGMVDGCVVQSNVRDGMAVDAAQATIINSTFTNNARNGVLVANGGTARVGITDRLTAAGNTITQNASTGVTVAQGSTATIAMNTITGNGTNPSLPRFGIAVSLAVASIAGGNTISNNAGQGVFAGTGSNVLLGDLSTGLTTVNTISENGNSASPGGVQAFLGSTIVVRDAVIDKNNGPGVTLNTRSQAQIFSSTISNNRDIQITPTAFIGGDGIRLVQGSALLPGMPASTISGNAGVGVQCFDFESSAVNLTTIPPNPPFLLFSGNGRGDVAPNCSGF